VFNSVNTADGLEKRACQTLLSLPLIKASLNAVQTSTIGHLFLIIIDIFLFLCLSDWPIWKYMAYIF
jgi:hypothetical protein